MTIQEFSKLSFSEKVTILKHEATLIDHYWDGGNLVYIYALNNFFIEATINPFTETIVDIIPFKRGFLSNKDYLNNHLRQNVLSFVKVA